LAEQGQVQYAKLAYHEAKEWDSSLEDSVGYFLSQLCRFGSFGGSPTDVMDVCNQAVELAPDDGWTYNDRGLARALTEEFEGAIEDFEFFVAWSRQNDLYEQFGQRREEWITELKNKRNPFDEATLDELRNE
jgi:hypothetical protein